MIVYKIRNKDGLFASGGKRPNWTKNGKVWTYHNLLRHLAIAGAAYQNGEFYVVSYNLVRNRALRLERFVEEFCEPNEGV